MQFSFQDMRFFIHTQCSMLKSFQFSKITLFSLCQITRYGLSTVHYFDFICYQQHLLYDLIVALFFDLLANFHEWAKIFMMIFTVPYLETELKSVPFLLCIILNLHALLNQIHQLTFKLISVFFLFLPKLFE